ncbi:hypothetical protein M408DRAFT_146733 [Serendipita vermifera MAFF 305830]|uniref:tRNA-splicing endonuclease subunit Sen15 domain-containing protein n=1 Tax=Serendipita vermifera MAFF 305830 TaxID=933852 RepID=A0A0C3B945_SERVB|nr:hypothetical protein M408DRAFT_146733 [Serendipita vermifera MAFF 305830]
MSHISVATLANKYPSNAGDLTQVYNDLHLAQRWRNVIAIDLDAAKRPALMGVKPDNEEHGVDVGTIVVPCSLSDHLSLNWIKDIFRAIELLKVESTSATDSQNEQVSCPSEWHRTFIYLAITSQDSSQVYYKLSDGIVKPQM